MIKIHRIALSLLCVCLFSSIFPTKEILAEDIVDKGSSFNLFDSQYLKVDLKFIDQAKGDFGIDYRLNLENRLSRRKDAHRSVQFNLKSDGFITVTGEENELNSIITEMNLELFPLWRIPGKAVESYSLEDEMKETEKEIVERTRRQAAAVHSPFWINADIHVKHESTQDFEDYDLAGGAAVSLSSSYLNGVLDYVFGLLRSKGNNNPRQMDIILAYDYVANLDNTANKILRDDQDNASRLNVKAEWETGIFKGDRISFLYNAFYEMNAPQKVKDADKDQNSFFMVKLEHILFEEINAKTQFAVKYTSGELPPNFEKGRVIGAGISVEF